METQSHASVPPAPECIVKYANDSSFSSVKRESFWSLSTWADNLDILSLISGSNSASFSSNARV